VLTDIQPHYSFTASPAVDIFRGKLLRKAAKSITKRVALKKGSDKMPEIRLNFIGFGTHLELDANTITKSRFILGSCEWSLIKVNMDEHLTVFGSKMQRSMDSRIVVIQLQAIFLMPNRSAFSLSDYFEAY